MDWERAAGAVAESDRYGRTGVGDGSAGSTLGPHNVDGCVNPPNTQTTLGPRGRPVWSRRGGPAHYKITCAVNGPVNGKVPLIRVTEPVTCYGRITSP